MRTELIHAIAALVFAASWSPLVGAIDIVVTYDAPRSQPPSFDVDAANLARLVENAATVFEDIIEDDFTVNLAYTWGDLGSEGTLALATSLEKESGKPAVSRMRFNTNSSVNWFIDPSPENDDEFTLRQTTVADFPIESIGDAYTGTPPSAFEVGFGGTRNQSDGTIDLYSVILHEMGHALGLTSLVIGSEANDGDFDIPPSFVGGMNVGIRVSMEDDVAHLGAPGSSMFPNITPDRRRLPSATDILAIASAAGWQEIDLPRKEFLGGGTWNTPQAWIGNRVPDAEDVVQVRSGDKLVVDQAAAAQQLMISDNSRLEVTSRLTVEELVMSGGEHVFKLSDEFQGIHVSGQAAALGSADVFWPVDLEIGATFTLLEAAALNERLELTPVPVVQGGKGLVIDRTANGLSATVAIVGDANTDGIVGFEDVLALSQTFGAKGDWRTGDFTGDDYVNFRDLLAVSANFGRSSEQLPMVPPHVATVPEPSRQGYFSLALFSVWVTRCRHRSREHRPSREIDSGKC